jgi:haloalkane dehalogenase
MTVSNQADIRPISPDFPYQSNFVEVHGSKIHYVDEGQGDPVLFLHGNPTSSYLWRNIISYVTSQARAIAPDLIGMGKSDKPDLDYRFVDHSKYVEGFIEKLGLENITFVIHDWGSALGFHYAARHQDNVKGLAIMEAILLPVPAWDTFPADFRQIFQAFRTPEVGWDLIVNQNIFVERILPGGIARKLSEEEHNRYREPYREPASRKPLWRWPNEIPIAGEPADVVQLVGAYNAWLQQTELPKLLYYADPGALMPGPVVDWANQSLRNLEAVDLGRGIHFLQEDHPHRIGEEFSRWYRSL